MIEKNEIKYEILKDVLSKGQDFTFTAEGTSMLPLITPGAKVTITNVKPEDLRRGEIALYRSGENVRLHRVVSLSRRGGETLIKMRGDAQTKAETVKASEIIGKLAGIEFNGKHFPARRLTPRGNKNLFFSALFVSAAAFGLMRDAKRLARKIFF